MDVATPSGRRRRPELRRREATAPRRQGATSAAGGSTDVRGRLLHVLLRARGELLAVLAAPLLHRFAGVLGRLLGDLLTALERLLPGLLRLRLDVVRDRTQLAILHAGGRDQQTGDEPDGHGSDGEAERVLLREAGRAASAVLDLLAIRRSVAGADDLRFDRLLGAHEALLRARLHVGLVGEGVDGVAHLVAGRLYVLADPVWVFAHWMSSFTVSTVCSGTGGVACCSSLRPRAARTAPTRPQRSVTIS